MRKIEQKLVTLARECLKNETSIDLTLSRRDKLRINARGNGSYYLWDNPIVDFFRGIIHVYDCGYRTNTTKSRINTFLTAFTAHPQLGVWSIDKVWYICKKG